MAGAKKNEIGFCVVEELVRRAHEICRAWKEKVDLFNCPFKDAALPAPGATSAVSAVLNEARFLGYITGTDTR